MMVMYGNDVRMMYDGGMMMTPQMMKIKNPNPKVTLRKRRRKREAK